MDISCSKSNRHFNSFESLQDCKKSCIDGECPYLKKEQKPITIPKLNKTTDELNENEKRNLLEITKELGTPSHKANWERIRFKSDSDLRELFYRRFKNLHRYRFYKGIE